MWVISPPTFLLLLGHDGVAEGEQPEEGVDLRVLHLHRFHQSVIVECEAGVGQSVEGEVHRLHVLLAEIRAASWQACKTPMKNCQILLTNIKTHLCDFYSLTHVVIKIT